MQRLGGKVAVVTGAAQGIGCGVALCLVEGGADVVVNDIVPETGMHEVLETVRQMGRQALAWRADVSDPAQVEAMIEGAVKHFGHLDIVVANAAYSVRDPFTELQWSDVNVVIATSQFEGFPYVPTCRKVYDHSRDGREDCPDWFSARPASFCGQRTLQHGQGSDHSLGADDCQ